MVPSEVRATSTTGAPHRWNRSTGAPRAAPSPRPPPRRSAASAGHAGRQRQALGSISTPSSSAARCGERLGQHVRSAGSAPAKAGECGDGGAVASVCTPTAPASSRRRRGRVSIAATTVLPIPVSVPVTTSALTPRCRRQQRVLAAHPRAGRSRLPSDRADRDAQPRTAGRHRRRADGTHVEAGPLQRGGRGARCSCTEDHRHDLRAAVADARRKDGGEPAAGVGRETTKPLAPPRLLVHQRARGGPRRRPSAAARSSR